MRTNLCVAVFECWHDGFGFNCSNFSGEMHDCEYKKLGKCTNSKAKIERIKLMAAEVDKIEEERV